jgi:hypothetical protein
MTVNGSYCMVQPVCAEIRKTKVSKLERTGKSGKTNKVHLITMMDPSFPSSCLESSRLRLRLTGTGKLGLGVRLLVSHWQGWRTVKRLVCCLRESLALQGGYNVHA